MRTTKGGEDNLEFLFHLCGQAAELLVVAKPLVPLHVADPQSALKLFGNVGGGSEKSVSGGE